MINSYLIVKGELTQKNLADTFKSWGYQVVIGDPDSPFHMAVTVFLARTVWLAFIIFLLTFTGLSLISRIKDLRSAGIRLISGESLYALMFRAVLKDGIMILQAILLSGVVGMIALKGLNLFLRLFVQVFFSGVLFYMGLLLTISALLSVVYAISVKQATLMSIIKGKLPLNRLIGVMLMGQCIALLSVTMSLNNLYEDWPQLLEQLSSSKEWDKQESMVTMTATVGAFSKDVVERERREQMWYLFAKDAIENSDALLVEHTLGHFIASDVSIEGVFIDDYHPDGKTLYVTPNYFERQPLPLEEGFKRQLNQLKPGEFGLVLPVGLKGEEAHYKALYEERMSELGVDGTELDSPVLYSVKSVVGYVPEGQNCFIYNQSFICKRQYLKDPIIVVVTPTSTGESRSAEMFWDDRVKGYLFLPDYDTSIELLKKHDTYRWISYVNNSRQLYYESLDLRKLDLINTIGGTTLGVVTSLLLYNSMNLLYFERFRREIFIKRVSGMGFFELHRNYLIVQMSTLVLSCLLSIAITGNPLVSVFTFLIFILDALIVLYQQMKKESQYEATVVKGA